MAAINPSNARRALRTQRRSRAESGYTLVELLVVVITLGILASIVIIGIGDARASAVTGVCRADVRSIQESASAVLARLRSDER